MSNFSFRSLKRVCFTFLACLFSYGSLAYENLDHGYYARHAVWECSTSAELHLVGKVKSVNYDDGSFFTFNEAGKLTEYQLNSFNSVVHNKYEYDSKNRLVRSSGSTNVNGAVTSSHDKKYVYIDSSFACVVYDTRSDTIVTQWSCDNNWRISYAYGCSYTYGTAGGAKGRLASKCGITYEYDINGRLIQVGKSEKFTYDEAGKIKSYELWKDGKISEQYAYYYNSIGGLVGCIHKRYHDGMGANGQPAFTETKEKFKMTYDKTGNWLTADFTGAYIGPMSRTIEYY